MKECSLCKSIRGPVSELLNDQGLTLLACLCFWQAVVVTVLEVVCDCFARHAGIVLSGQAERRSLRHRKFTAGLVPEVGYMGSLLRSHDQVWICFAYMSVDCFVYSSGEITNLRRTNYSWVPKEFEKWICVAARFLRSTPKTLSPSLQTKSQVFRRN